MENPRTKFWKLTFKSQEDHDSYMQFAAKNDAWDLAGSDMEEYEGKFILSVELRQRRYRNQLLKGVKGIYVDIAPDK